MSDDKRETFEENLKHLVEVASRVIEDHDSDRDWDWRANTIDDLRPLVLEFQVRAAANQAREIGREHGVNAAGWMLDGNTDRDTYVSILRGIDDVDPEVMDTIPHADLSGQFADGYTVNQLCADTDAPPDDPDHLLMYSETIADAYTEAFDDAAMSEVTRMCRYALGFESESAAVQASIDGDPVACRTCYGPLKRHGGQWVHESGPLAADLPPEPLILDDNA